MISRKVNVCVIGGGISGLTTAYLLSNKGYSVTLLEKTSRFGGAIRSEIRNGFTMEEGPNTVLNGNDYVEKLLSELELFDKLITADPLAKSRYIIRDKKLHRLPMGLKDLWKTNLLSGKAKRRLIKEPFVEKNDVGLTETLAEFTERRLGSEVLDYIVNPFVAGIYAGKPDTIELKSAFPRLVEMEQVYGSIFKAMMKSPKSQATEGRMKSRQMFTLSGGLETLIRSITGTAAFEKLLNVDRLSIHRSVDGYRINGMTEGETFEFNADAVYSTIPAYAYSHLQGDVFPEISDHFQSVNYPPLAMVYFGFNKSPVMKTKLDGFGFLVPERENLPLLGSLWSSTIFPHVAPEGGTLLTTFVGGSRQPELAELSDIALAEHVAKALKELLGINSVPDLLKICRWDRSIPQYQLGHAELQELVSRFESKNAGIFLGGNVIKGISVPDCIKNAYLNTERICSFLNAPLGELNQLSLPKTTIEH